MTKRDRIVIAVILTAGILGAMWFLVLTPKRSESAALDGKIQKQQQRLAQAQTGTAAARDAKASYEHDYAAVAALGQAVPADDETASLIYQLDRAAKKAHVDFRSLKVEGGAPAPAPPPAPAADPAAAGAAPATPAAATPAVPAGTPVADFPKMPFSFIFTGSFFNFERFLRKVAAFTAVRGQRINVHGRLLSIDSIEFSEAKKFPAVTATVKATAYLLPESEGLTNGATVAGPTGTGSGATTPAGGSGSAPVAPAAATAITPTGGSK